MSLSKIVFNTSSNEVSAVSSSASEHVCYIFTIYSDTPHVLDLSISSSSDTTATVDNNSTTKIWFEADSFMRLLKCEKQFESLLSPRYNINNKPDNNNNDSQSNNYYHDWPLKWLMFWDELCVYLNEQNLESMFKCRLKCDTMSPDATTRHQLTSRELLRWCEETAFVSLECIQYLLLSALTIDFTNKSTFTKWLDEFSDRVKYRRNSFNIEYVDLAKRNNVSTNIIYSSVNDNDPSTSTTTATVAVNDKPNRGDVGGINNNDNNQYLENNERTKNVNYLILTKQFETILSSVDEYKMLLDVPIISTTNSPESIINTKCILEKQQTFSHKHQSMTDNYNITDKTAATAASITAAPPATNSIIIRDNVTSSTSSAMPQSPPAITANEFYEYHHDNQLHKHQINKQLQHQQQQQQQHYEYMSQIQQASILYKYLGNQQYQQQQQEPQQHQCHHNYIQYGNIGSTTATTTTSTTTASGVNVTSDTWWYWATNAHLQNLGIVNMGCTNNPDKRMLILNMGTMTEYKYLALFKVNNRWQTEKMINEMFKCHHIQRGFYKFDISTISMSDTILKYMKRCMVKNYELFLIRHKK